LLNRSINRLDLSIDRAAPAWIDSVSLCVPLQRMATSAGALEKGGVGAGSSSLSHSILNLIHLTTQIKTDRNSNANFLHTRLQPKQSTMVTTRGHEQHEGEKGKVLSLKPFVDMWLLHVGYGGKWKKTKSRRFHVRRAPNPTTTLDPTT
jgi:hypothetical protein